MKKLLIIVIALTSMVVTAHAKMINQDGYSIEAIEVQPNKVHHYLLGKWCSNDGVHYDRNSECAEDSMIEITANSFDGLEFGCRFTRVNSWVSSIAMATKTRGSPAARVIANCYGEGCTSRNEITLEFYAKAGLLIRNRMLGKSDCRG
jgi:hypothetical protein